LTNGLRKRGNYTKWNFTQPQRRMKFCHLQVNAWNWRTSPKATCSLSYVEYRPETNAAILCAMGPLRGGHTGRDSTRERNKKS
jgi:hypothetical protein